MYRHKPKDRYEESLQMGQTEWSTKEHYLQSMRDEMASRKAKYSGGFYNPNAESYFHGASKTVGHVPGKYYKVEFRSRSGAYDTYIGEKRWEKYGGKEDYKRHVLGKSVKSSKRGSRKSGSGSSGG